MKKSSIVVILIGIVLVVAGLVQKVPSDELSYYGTSDKSKIEEYVGGDAYNYIIGASLVGSQIAGAMIQKAIYISVGLLIISLGIISARASSRRTESEADLSGKQEETSEPAEQVPQINEDEIPDL